MYVDSKAHDSLGTPNLPERATSYLNEGPRGRRLPMLGACFVQQYMVRCRTPLCDHTYIGLPQKHSQADKHSRAEGFQLVRYRRG